MAFSKKSFVFGVVSLAALGLVACGDDSGRNNFSFAPTNGDQVGSIYELGQCSAEREGVSVLVTDENTYYLCTSAEWKPVAEYNDSVSSSTLTPSSSSTPTEDLGSSSSVKDPEQVDGSSSSVIASEAKQSSSSVVSSSSVTSSSSVESSSSSAPIEDLSSSSSIKVPEPAEGSSSSKANWAYLNPAKTYGTMTDIRDGQVYKTVTIGTQTWMAENLNYNPGDVSDMGSDAWSGCYSNKDKNCNLYGRLYTWEVAMDNADCAYGKTCNAPLNPSTPVRGVCPQGWHLPSHYEFEELINFIDPTFDYNHTTDAYSSTAGLYLKSQSGWNSNGNGTDAYGFSALPGGSRRSNGYFDDAGNYAYFWSSGEYFGSSAFLLYLLYGGEGAGLDWDGEISARSVRCLQN